VDAVEFDGEAGDVIVVEPDRAIGPISTHYLPLSVMAGVLRNENIDSILIGFRPSSSNLGECPSEAVKRSVEGVVDILIDG
jgi:Ni,Fe-hydrogenase maturation factor